MDDANSAPAKSAKIQQRIEFTGKQKLRILINAIEHAVLNVGDMEKAILLSLKGRFTRIEFVPDGTNERPFVLEENEIEQRKQSRSDLKDTLRQLRVEIDVN